MRFVGPYPELMVILRHQEVERLADGTVRQKPVQNAHGLYAKFEARSFLEYERVAAYERFGSQIQKGSRFTDETLTMPASQLWRIGTFDSTWISNLEDRKLIEEKLLNHPRYGLDFIMVERPKLELPFPNWNTLRGRGQRTTPELLVERVRELGIDPEYAIAVERQELGRQDVIDALEQLLGGEVEETVEVEA